MDTLFKAKSEGVISEGMYNVLKPFFEFKNALIHRYWIMDDKLILKNLRKGYKNFFKFIEEIEGQINKINQNKT